MVPQLCKAARRKGSFVQQAIWDIATVYAKVGVSPHMKCSDLQIGAIAFM